MSQSQFASTVNAYCEERSNSSSAAVSAGVAGYSGSASRAEASYGKFCSRDTDDRGSESDYNEYMEGVQPGAYAAFAACEAARDNDGVQFEMSDAPARDRLVLGIYNRSTTGAMADMQWDGSDPVTCQWAGDAGGTPRRTLQPNERVFLECRRSSFDSEPLREPDAVDVFRADGGNAAVLNIPWPKYGPDNSPVQTLEEIRQQLDTEVARLRNEVNALETRMLELAQEPIFGDWKPVVVSEIHRAESDGFLTAFSGGNGNIAAILLETGESADRLGVRNRGGRYEGAAIPVKKGHYYRVRMGSGSGGTVNAFWLQVGR